jgi:dUTP pyrophosphatase
MRFYLVPEACERGVIPPVQPAEGDAGYDLRSMEACEILPGTQCLVRTGLHLAIPAGWVGLLKERSSLAQKRIYVHSGVIDSTYRGEVLVVLENGGREPFQVQVNDKIVQMVVVPHYAGAMEGVERLSELGETARGAKGFGSTGRQ